MGLWKKDILSPVGILDLLETLATDQEISDNIFEDQFLDLQQDEKEPIWKVEQLTKASAKQIERRSYHQVRGHFVDLQLPKEVELEVANGGFVDTVVEYGWESEKREFGHYVTNCREAIKQEWGVKPSITGQTWFQKKNGRSK